MAKTVYVPGTDRLLGVSPEDFDYLRSVFADPVSVIDMVDGLAGQAKMLIISNKKPILPPFFYPSSCHDGE